MRLNQIRKIQFKSIDSIRPLLSGLMHTLSFGFILVLPIGIYQDNPDSTSATISGHIGTGQYASVLRDCSGPVAAVGNTCNDYSLNARLAVPPRKNSPLSIGFGVGEWRTKSHSYPIRSYDGNTNTYKTDRSPSQQISFRYFNPNISMETALIGMGFGYISGYRPLNLSEGSYGRGSDMSFHVRFGNPRKYYFITSLNENTPLVSGGGYFDLGFGLANKKAFNIYFGISGGLYDSPGFLFQTQIPLRKHLLLSGAMRYGQVAGVSETGISGGLILGL